MLSSNIATTNKLACFGASWLGLAFLVCAPVIASAGTNENPYQAIADRNAFGLKAPAPPPIEVDDPPAPPAMDIKLTGVCSLLSNKRVLLRILESGCVDPKYYSLAEGEKAGDLEVVSIDMETPLVRIRRHGDIIAINFDTHGIKSPSVAVPAQAPATGRMTSPESVPPAGPSPPAGAR